MDKQESSFKNSSPKTESDDQSKENKTKGRGRKRKRVESDSDSDTESALPDNCLEVEKSLHASALKNNLDDTSVKKILKKVVTNDHVLALVKLREEEEALGNESPGVEPKRTRSKTKELMKVDPERSLWPIQLSPIKEIPVKTRPEVTALIAQELPEDEDDDEYQPTHDDVPSDDDQTLESCSDLDSQPRTPATPQMASPCVLKDGPFKVPQDTPVRRKLLIEEEEATIALRTRSKLSLSHTPIEHIESSFVPPDDIPPAVDDLWSEFLSGVLNPEVQRHDEDDDTDPEYNVAADPDANEDDEDAIEKILRISKKELNDLMTELLHVMPEPEDISDVLTNNVFSEPANQTSNHWEGKQEPLSDNENEGPDSGVKEKRHSFTRLSIGKSEKEDPEYERHSNEERDRDSGKEKDKGNANSTKVDISIEEQSHSVEPPSKKAAPPPILRDFAATSETVYITVEGSVQFLPEQILLLQQQLRQHIQLAASNFLQLYINPTHWAKAPTYKEYLNQLHNIYKSNPKSVVNVCNLLPAVELVDSWEKSVSADTPENKKMVEFIQSEEERCRRRFISHGVYIGDFPETFKKVIANSTVFLYPYLLPPRPYRPENAKRFSYRLCEDELIALGLDQFWQYVYDNPQIYKPPSKLHAKKRWGMNHTLQLICKYLLPWATPRGLWGHISKCKKEKDNPIAKFFEKYTVEPMKHKLLPFGANLTLYEQPEHEMPRIWVRYLAKSSRRFKDYYYKGRCSGLPPANGVTINMGELIQTPKKPALPIDFTKTIVSNRINVKRKEPIVHTPDRYDVNIVGRENMPQNVYVVGNMGTNGQTPIAVENDGKIVGNLIPVNTMYTPNTRDKTNAISVRNILAANNLVLTPQVPQNNYKNPLSNSTPNSNNIAVSPKNSSSHIITISNGNIILENTPKNSTKIDETNEPNIEKDMKKRNTDTNNKTDTVNEIKNKEPNFNDLGSNMNSARTINTVVSMSNNTNTTDVSKMITSPIEQSKADHTQQSLFRVIETSTGMVLVPMSRGNAEINNIIENTDSSKDIVENNHCKCCLILKKIDKQKKITDFFKHKNDKAKSNACDCNKLYPKISKRLKLLLSSFKAKSFCVYRAIGNKLIEHRETNIVDGKVDDHDFNDIATVNSYQMKFIIRTGMSRDIYLKRKVYKCLSNFDPETDNPVELADLLYKHFGVDFVDLYKDFIMFLTPHQADKTGRFKDYFVLNIVEDLVKKIEEEIKDKDRRIEMLHVIKNMTSDNCSTSCEMCSVLLSKMFEYPRLAKYVFELFPHRSRQIENDHSRTKQYTSEPSHSVDISQNLGNVPVIQEHMGPEYMEQEPAEESLVIDYEADDSSSEYEDSYDQILLPSPQAANEANQASIDRDDSSNVINTAELTVSKTEVQEYDSATDMSMLVMSEDDTTIKSETPEWKRDEDKHILQALMEHLQSQNKRESILEIIEEKNIYKTLSESLTDKSIDDIRNRVMYLINILVVNDFK